MRRSYFRNRVTWSYTKFESHSTFLFLCTGSVVDNMKLLKHWKLEKMIFQNSENSMDNFRVSDPIDEISVWRCKLDSHNSIKICENAENILPGLWILLYHGAMTWCLRCWFPIQGLRVQNHWVAPRWTQPFIVRRSIKSVPGIYGNWMVKSKLPPRRGCSPEAVEPNP